MTYKIPFALIAEQLKKNRLTVLETQHERLEKLLGKLMAREDFLDVRAPYLLKQAEKKVSPADTEHQLWQAATQASFAAERSIFTKSSSVIKCEQEQVAR